MSGQQGFFGLMSALGSGTVETGLILEGKTWAHGKFTFSSTRTSAYTVTHGLASPKFFLAFNVDAGVGAGAVLAYSRGSANQSGFKMPYDSSGQVSWTNPSGTASARVLLNSNTCEIKAASGYALAAGTWYWICVE